LYTLTWFNCCITWLSHCTRGTDSSTQGRIPHALHQRFTQFVHFLGIIGSKSRRYGGSIVHPALELELAHHFLSVRLGTALCHLVTSHIWLVQVVDKVYRQLDQEIALGLVVVRVCQPVVKVRPRAKPQHGVRSVLHPKALLPLFHDNGSKGNATQDKSLFANEFSLGQGRRSRRSHLGQCLAVLVAGNRFFHVAVLSCRVLSLKATPRIRQISRIGIWVRC